MQPLKSTQMFLSELVLVSAAAAMAGGVLANQLWLARPQVTVAIVAGPVAETGGLSLRVESTAWEYPDLDPKPESPSSSSKRQLRRLEVRMSLQNPTDQPQAVSSHEFHLRARSGTVWPAVSVLPATLVESKHAVTSILEFTVPAQAAGLQFVWTKAGREVRIPLADAASNQGRGGSSGTITGHSHGPAGTIDRG